RWPGRRAVAAAGLSADRAPLVLRGRGHEAALPLPPAGAGPGRHFGPPRDAPGRHGVRLRRIRGAGGRGGSPARRPASFRAPGPPADVLAGQLARDAQSVWLSHRVEPDAAAAIDNLKLPGVYVVVRPQRGYPHGWMAADVLGYTGLDNQGLAGLEWLLEKELAGVPGEHFSERDPRGRAIAGSRSQVRQAEPGHDVVLTLDAVLQYIAEQEVAQGVQA